MREAVHSAHSYVRLTFEVFSPSLESDVATGEFEKHAGCWMGWPYDGNLWRDNAKPAQKQYAAIATAISQFEPLTMFAHPGEVQLHAPLPTFANS